MADIVIVQKQSLDASHQNAKEILISHLKKFHISYEIFTLDEIYAQKMLYYHPTEPTLGFHPARKLVVALGGDGTLLHASHYVGNDVRLLGINSSPATSVGHMCALKADEITTKFNTILEDPHCYKHVQRLQICFQKSDHLSVQNQPCDRKHSEFEILPLCLNDALICHKHPAGTTRVEVSLYDRNTQKRDEYYKVFSSGLWVSTVMGLTAAISSYGFSKESHESDSIFVAIREPYFPKNSKAYPKTFQFHNQVKQLQVFSKMRGEGLICVDGPDSCTHFKDGDTVIFNAPKNAELKLVL